MTVSGRFTQENLFYLSAVYPVKFSVSTFITPYLSIDIFWVTCLSADSMFLLCGSSITPRFYPLRNGLPGCTQYTPMPSCQLSRPTALFLQFRPIWPSQAMPQKVARCQPQAQNCVYYPYDCVLPRCWYIACRGNLDNRVNYVQNQTLGLRVFGLGKSGDRRLS